VRRRPGELRHRDLRVGLCSTPWNVCVGGRRSTTSIGSTGPVQPFDPSLPQSRAPEIVWNESGTTAGGSGLLATGGGRSAIYPKPDWQQAPGVPNDGKRDVPDVSLSAAAHDGYVVFQDYNPAKGTVFVVSGTSASAPAWAGIMALVVQSQGGRRQGSANPVLYRIGKDQYSGGSARVFHDIVSGNNSVPGVAGFSASPGYDLATGLGSVDAAASCIPGRPRLAAAHDPAGQRAPPCPRAGALFAVNAGERLNNTRFRVVGPAPGKPEAAPMRDGPDRAPIAQGNPRVVSEVDARADSESPGLVREEAHAGRQASFTIERELRALIGDVVDVSDVRLCGGPIRALMMS
jgi:hypothetical protein